MTACEECGYKYKSSWDSFVHEWQAHDGPHPFERERKESSQEFYRRTRYLLK